MFKIYLKGVLNMAKNKNNKDKISTKAKKANKNNNLEVAEEIQPKKK